MGFWDEPQGAAIFKHAVLKTYAPLYANKTGKWSADHKVALIDGFAGQGWYDDETPASAALMLKVAEELTNRKVRCWFVEADPATFKTLDSRVRASPAAGSATVLAGDISEHLPSILNEIGSMPLLAFVDPFGIGLPFEQLVGQLLARDKGGPAATRAKTEVLLTFVHAGIYRSAGKLNLLDNADVADNQRLNALATVQRLDQNLGGDWWHELVGRVDFVHQVRSRYLARVLDAAGKQWSCLRVPVADTRGGSPIYDMVLFTRHREGLWFFNESVSLARGVFEEHVDPDKPMTLFEPPEEWIGVIKGNLKKMLIQGQTVRVIDRLNDVYGETLGYARGRHVKDAAKRLVEDGFNAGSTNVNPDKLVLVPGRAVKKS